MIVHKLLLQDYARRILCVWINLGLAGEMYCYVILIECFHIKEYFLIIDDFCFHCSICIRFYCVSGNLLFICKASSYKCFTDISNVVQCLDYLPQSTRSLAWHRVISPRVCLPPLLARSLAPSWTQACVCPENAVGVKILSVPSAPLLPVSPEVG